MGAAKWRPEHSEFLRDADVIILPDNDEAGGKHVDIVAASLQNIAASVRVLDLPDLPDTGDVLDWAKAGGTVESLHELIERFARPWEKTAHESVFDPWEQYIVPDFPLHVLPSAVQKYVTSQSLVIGCDPSALAMAALTAISGALDHRFAVKMMRNGRWWEHPRLWTLLVGDPSCKKTPVVNDVTVPLERHQTDLRRSYEAALRDYEAAKKDKDDKIEKPDPPPRYVVGTPRRKSLAKSCHAANTVFGQTRRIFRLDRRHGKIQFLAWSRCRSRFLVASL
jgi:hypothetical protein